MKKLFQSKEFFDGSIVNPARVFLYEVVEDEHYKIIIKSAKNKIEHDIKRNYNSATFAFDKYCKQFNVGVE